MRIEHIALYLRDLEKGKRFFEVYFGGKAGEKYHNPRTGFSSYFLGFEDGSRLELMNAPDLAEDTAGLKRTGWIHMAFSAGSKEQVDVLTQQLRQDGYEVLSGPRTTGDGYYESCIMGPEGCQIEITV